MFNLSETAKISCHYEPFTTAGAIFRETDRTNLFNYSQYFDILKDWFELSKLFSKKDLE